MDHTIRKRIDTDQQANAILLMPLWAQTKGPAMSAITPESGHNIVEPNSGSFSDGLYTT
jgi:hypothetical protein